MCDGRTDGWTDGQTDGLIDRQSEEVYWVDKQMDGRTERMMDGGKCADFATVKNEFFTGF